MEEAVPPAAIELRSVVKRFGELTAVDHLDLTVPNGICLGLLGPNGAGKSTTMRMLTAQAIATEGTISVLGYSLPAESKAARMAMGVVPQQDNLDVELTCRQILTVFARLYRVPRTDREAAIERALQIANLVNRADTVVRELSGGMRRRLLVARGLIHRPRLVLLDEPTVGLDPQVRQELWSLIDGLRAEGVTVLMSTHYIEEAERLADTVAVMSAGRIIAQGTPGELVGAHAGREVIEVYGPPAELAELEADAERRGWLHRRSGPSIALLRAEDLDGDAPEGVRRPANLEDAFVALTGEEIE
jgi:lipooligosaccharide transport system ATP-binding protein